MLFNKLISTTVAAASALTALAAPAHVHNQHKRDVVVVTETQTVVVTAGAPLVIDADSTTLTLSTVNTALAASISLSTTISRAPQVADTTVAETTVASETTTSSIATSVASSTFVPSGKGISYSPYTSAGACKALEEVKSDLAKLSDYDIIRLYGVDCSQVEFVLQAKATGQKLFLGIFFVDAIEAGISQIASAVAAHGSWDDVYTVAIGNELVNDGEATVAQIASYVATGRSALTAAGYSGPVVSVDTHIATINNPGLCDISDYIAINAHAYFDYNTEAADAGAWLLLQIQRVWSACGGNKNVFVTESGWPHQGDTYGKAIASPEAQAAAISSLVSTVGNDVILFTAFDDLWKADGSLQVEKYWGII